jgi:hypothetical protein
MPRPLRYDEPYLLDERTASPIRHSGIRWGIGLVRFRRILTIAGCSSESWLTTQPSRSGGEAGERQKSKAVIRLLVEVIGQQVPFRGLRLTGETGAGTSPRHTGGLRRGQIGSG